MGNRYTCLPRGKADQAKKSKQSSQSPSKTQLSIGEKEKAQCVIVVGPKTSNLTLISENGDAESVACEYIVQTYYCKPPESSFVTYSTTFNEDTASEQSVREEENGNRKTSADAESKSFVGDRVEYLNAQDNRASMATGYSTPPKPFISYTNSIYYYRYSRPAETCMKTSVTGFNEEGNNSGEGKNGFDKGSGDAESNSFEGGRVECLNTQDEHRDLNRSSLTSDYSRLPMLPRSNTNSTREKEKNGFGNTRSYTESKRVPPLSVLNDGDNWNDQDQDPYNIDFSELMPLPGMWIKPPCIPPLRKPEQMMVPSSKVFAIRSRPAETSITTSGGAGNGGGNNDLEEGAEGTSCSIMDKLEQIYDMK